MFANALVLRLKFNMAWKPNLKEEKNIKHGTLIGKAKAKFEATFREENLINKVQDKHGVFGWEFDSCFLVAKSYIYGNIVSAHLKLTTYASHIGKKLVMYIDDQDKFYEFNPDNILTEGKQNLRGDIPMINFNISLGKNKEAIKDGT